MRAWLTLAVVVGATGCAWFDDGDPPETMMTPPRGLGEPCDAMLTCRAPLACGEDGTCRARGDSPAGTICQLSEECASGLYCAADRTCTEGGVAGEGEPCGSQGDCDTGLRCVIQSGFSATCEPTGESDVGVTCAADLDCAAGLSCLADPGGEGLVCTSPPPLPAGTPAPPSFTLWPGVECETEDPGPARAYFEVPVFDGSDDDFYRLPFPNDVRRGRDGIDLRNHPSPSTAIEGADLIDRYLRNAEEDLEGFSTNPVVFFRFSTEYDWDSVGGQLRFVDIDPDSPDYGRDLGLAWLTTSGPISRYICDDWLAVRSGSGAPLRHDTTYAVIVGSGVVPGPDVEDATSFERDADFVAMMQSAPPSAELEDAHAAYAPLRDWLESDPETDADDVLVAAVFTTQPETDIEALRDAVRTEEIVVSELTACGAGVTSPCDDGTEQRSCENPDGSSYTEIHGRIALPIFQQGTPPYMEPEDGGGFEWTPSGPVVQRTEEVCFAMTVPDDPMPDEGWPLVVVGHGTGGSYRTAVRNGLAEAMADSSIPAVTLAIDLPQHGERRGESTIEPQFLFFNFANPRAARDNNLQGTADMLSLVHWAMSGDVPAADSPTGSAIRFDPAAIAMFVHSQGANHASLMGAWEDDVSGIVFSGLGGDLTQSLLTKTEPVNISAVVPLALQDPDGAGNLAGGGFHPALALFQMYFDSVDPVNFGRRYHREPLEGRALKHVFMTYGLGDSYSTEATMQAFAGSAQLTHAGEPLVTLPVPLGELPLQANIIRDEVMYTIGMRSYEPTADLDGHFVSTRTQDGRADTRRFLREVLEGSVPQIGSR